MARKKGNRPINRSGQQIKPIQQKTVVPVQPKSDIHELADDGSKAAIAGANETDIEQVGEIQVPPTLSSDDLINLYQQMEEARRLFDAQRTRLETETQKVVDQKESYEQKLRQVEVDQADLLEQQAEIARKATQVEVELVQIKERQDELSRLEADLTRREANAQAGFLDQYREASEHAQAQIAEYRDTLARLTSELADTRNQALQQLQVDLNRMRLDSEEHFSLMREELNHQLETERKKLKEEKEGIDKEQHELGLEKGRIQREKSRLETDQMILKEDREKLEETVEKLVEKSTQRVVEELEYFKERFQEANKYREQYKNSLIAWDEITRKVGKDATEILALIESLEKERDGLQQQLLDAPSSQDLDRLQTLESQKEEWENERFRLGRELAEANRKLVAARQQVIEYEDLRTEVLTLEASRKTLLQRNKELREEISARLEKDAEGEAVFPRCYEIDREFSNSTITEEVTDLKELATQAQSRIAREGLYYSDRDIRSLVAGLAMSRMVILQGISGTGKTSLPVQFARAIGGDCEVIEVQAGWRDRDDLLGHFNAFERRFYEKKFLQALYRAGRPALSDRLFLILLDEMNLSYPEQYFADFLSVLERDKDEHWIDLIPRSLPGRPSPAGFDNGRRIAIPPNVWFVGTANRDETTKDIADKTYDRAHVIELPVRYPPLKNLSSITSSAPTISFKSLQMVFQKAQSNKDYQVEVERAWVFLDSLRSFLGKRLSAGWGNRLRIQLSVYLPVLRACGGTWSDAVDDLLALKILRKIRDRYEIQYSDLEELLLELEKGWNNVDDKVRNKVGLFDGLKRTVDLIDEEQNKKKLRQAEEIGA